MKTTTAATLHPPPRPVPGARDWTDWQPFPDPDRGGMLTAPIGACCYELRNRSNAKLVLFGSASHGAERMSSLLPAPLGSGRRRNMRKRDYVAAHLSDIEYRTRPCTTRDEARAIEAKLKAGNSYEFET